MAQEERRYSCPSLLDSSSYFGEMLDPQNFIKKGYMTKSPPLTKVTSRAKRWCRRWFVLYDPSISGSSQSKLILYYFTTQETMAKGESAKEIDLSQCTNIMDRKDAVHGHENVIDVVLPKRTFHLCAESIKDKEEWLQTLRLHVLNEMTMLSSSDEPDNTLAVESEEERLSRRAEFQRKLETLNRQTKSSVSSWSSCHDDAGVESGHNSGTEELYSSMSFDENNGGCMAPKSIGITAGPIDCIRLSGVSNGSNQSTDDGIVVTPRNERSRWSWDRSSVNSDDDGSDRDTNGGFTGPKLIGSRSSSKTKQLSPKLMQKSKSMFNLTENLSRLVTEYDGQDLRTSSDSGTPTSRLSSHRGSRCASLLEEFRLLARIPKSNDNWTDSSRRFSKVTEEF